MENKDTHFSIESWNHKCFNDKYYTMLWGPFPISTINEITSKIIKNFDKEVKYITYRHPELKERA